MTRWLVVAVLTLGLVAGSPPPEPGSAGMPPATVPTAAGPTAAGQGVGGPVAERTDTGATVVLLHGLARTEWSMSRLAAALEEAGYRVVNLGYPSRSYGIGALTDTVATELARCCADADTIHFVAHSLGGILVRAWVQRTNPRNLGRVVMLSPPNQGTSVADRIPNPLLRLAMGPASLQLGTDSSSVPARLPPVDFELGVITGDATLNPLFSWWLSGEDDGMVPVESAWVEGVDDFLVVPYTHTFIMYRDRVIEEVLSFLRTGRFSEAHAS